MTYGSEGSGKVLPGVMRFRCPPRVCHGVQQSWHMLRNRYRILERLGSGATGSVYAAIDLRAGGARVALKALWQREGDELLNQRLAASLRAEFRTLAILRHPRLCRVYDFG